jgi:hypothetical protein
MSSTGECGRFAAESRTRATSPCSRGFPQFRCDCGPLRHTIANLCPNEVADPAACPGASGCRAIGLSDVHGRGTSQGPAPLTVQFPRSTASPPTCCASRGAAGRAPRGPGPRSGGPARWSRRNPGCGQRSPCLRVGWEPALDDLDVVPARVEHERAVVARVVDGALARWAVVLVARRQRRGVKRAHRGVLARREREVNVLGEPPLVADEREAHALNGRSLPACETLIGASAWSAKALAEGAAGAPSGKVWVIVAP